MATQVVSFHCVLKNKLGHVIGRTYNQDIVVAGQTDEDKLVGLIDGLKDIKAGERRKICLSAEQAYGFYDPDLIIECHPEQMQVIAPLNIGDKFIFASKNKERVYRLIELSAEKIVFDANHPLAGQDLIFEIEATEAREATNEDLQDDQFVMTPIGQRSVVLH